MELLLLLPKAQNRDFSRVHAGLRLSYGQYQTVNPLRCLSGDACLIFCTIRRKDIVYHSCSGIPKLRNSGRGCHTTVVLHRAPAFCGLSESRIRVSCRCFALISAVNRSSPLFAAVFGMLLLGRRFVAPTGFPAKCKSESVYSYTVLSLS